MLWVVACPRCRHAKVCAAGQKTTTCGHCSRTLRLDHLRKHAETASADEAQRAAGLLNARLAGKLDAFVAEAVPEPPPRPRGDSRARVRRVAEELAARGPFDAAAFAGGLAKAGLDAGACEEHLERLVAAGVLVEPRRGRYARGPG